MSPTAATGVWDAIDSLGFIPENINTTLFASFCATLGFLLVFRTSQAMLRFMDGLKCIYGMTASYYEACSSLMSFSGTTKKSPEEIEAFRHLLVRLFSMLHSAALHEIAAGELTGFQTIDEAGLDDESTEFLNAAKDSGHDQSRVLHQWIQNLIVKSHEGGMLAVPPPILSRVFQELADGMGHLDDARRIAHIPFPFPYAQMTVLLLLLHMVITPVICSIIASHWIWAGVLCFIMVISGWSINFIAAEIEQPFQDDANDLPMLNFQVEMNKALMLLLDHRMHVCPALHEDAPRDIHEIARSTFEEHHCFRVPAPSSRSMTSPKSAQGHEATSPSGLESSSPPSPTTSPQRVRGDSSIPTMSPAKPAEDSRVEAKPQAQCLKPSALPPGPSPDLAGYASTGLDFSSSPLPSRGGVAAVDLAPPRPGRSKTGTAAAQPEGDESDLGPLFWDSARPRDGEARSEGAGGSSAPSSPHTGILPEGQVGRSGASRHEGS